MKNPFKNFTKEEWILWTLASLENPAYIPVVMNFTKPTENKPALLTFNEVETFLHEFGHSLHGMFANSTYKSLIIKHCFIQKFCF